VQWSGVEWSGELVGGHEGKGNEESTRKKLVASCTAAAALLFLLPACLLLSYLSFVMDTPPSGLGCC